MKKDLKTRLVSRKIKKPNPLLIHPIMLALGALNKHYGVEFSYDYDPRTIKKQPAILLSSHASRLEFIYSIYGFGRTDINVVCGYQNVMQKGLYRLLISLGVISKYLYQPDLMCVKNMLKVLRRGGAIGLFPEGIQSTSGSTHPINPATAQFLKRSKANIVVCSTRGAYLATSRYSKDRKKGYIGAHFSLLFTPEMLEALTEEQIYERLLEKFSYNDFEFNKTARNKYVGKKPNAYGIDNILYKCPSCKKEHTLSVLGDCIICESCGFSARVNEYYELIAKDGSALPFTVDAWFKWQRRCVKDEINDGSFEMSLCGSLCTVRLDKLKKPPKDRVLLSTGKATLTSGGLAFEGTKDKIPADFDFSARAIYSLTLSTQGYLEFYHNNEYYMLIPDTAKRGLIKWTLAAEEIHNLYDEKWQAASDDAYNYSKGDILWTEQTK